MRFALAHSMSRKHQTEANTIRAEKTDGAAEELADAPIFSL